MRAIAALFWASGLLIGETAFACSIAHEDARGRTFFADWVRAAATIDIARVVEIRSLTLSGDAPPSGRSSGEEPTHEIAFETVERLKGRASDTFQIRVAYPGGFTPEQLALGDQDALEQHAGVYFWNVVNLYDTPVNSDCSPVWPNFVEGVQFLVFRDATGAPIAPTAMYGRNYEIVPAHDDAWLSAVRQLIADPTRSYGRSMTPREFVSRHGLMSVIHQFDCAGVRVIENELHPESTSLSNDDWLDAGRYVPAGEVSWGGVGDLAFRFNERTCRTRERDVPDDECAAFDTAECTRAIDILALPLRAVEGDTEHGGWYFDADLFPIRDGLVDFSAPRHSQIELVGDLSIPLDQVIGWLERE